MGSTSALSIIRKLNDEIPFSVKKGEEFVETVNFLNRELSFAEFAIAKSNATGELPQDQYYATKNFPVFDPRTLEQAISLKQSVTEPLNQIFVVPCLFEGTVTGVLFAKHLRGTWNQSEMILVEIAATEMGRIMSPNQPGLTLNANLKNKSKNFRSAAPQIIGSSDKLKQMLSILDRVAPTTASVLVLGESGTGKELVARRIHSMSERKDGPFVAINCGAITENLLESELFGHEKGSFTGASATKKGLVEIAQNGTLFLDEIGEMPVSLQAKLLRFLQEGEFFRVGGKESIHVDVRIISATNRDLESEVRNAKFREDLYYRLNTITLKAPALRERKEDLPALIEFFAPGTLDILSREALEQLKTYSWPGNIRELQNAVERMRIMATNGRIEIQDLPVSVRNPTQDKLKYPSATAAAPVEMPLEELERIHILRCLGHFDGNKTRAAQSLGITIKTLYNKLHRYGILDKTDATL